MSRRAVGLLALALLGACDDGGEPAAPPDARAADAAAHDARVVDAAPDAEARLDAAPRLDARADAQPRPDAAPDAAPDATRDAAPDAAPPPRCVPQPPAPPAPSGPLPPAASSARGVDAWERPAFDRLRAAALSDEGVHFVATYDHAADRFEVFGGPADARAAFAFRREDAPTGTTYRVVEGDLAAVFPDTRADVHGDYADLLAAFEPGTAPDLTALGYGADDPRVGFLPYAAQSWPLPLERIATVFDAPDAPDAVGGVFPWARPSGGTHGGLGLLQSRATLVLGGAGVRRGVVLDAPARLTDVAPTVLAALGAPTTGGVGPDGRYADGLHLTRQDGWPRWDALDPDPCARVDHVVVVLFDGLLATELNHQVLDADPEVDLPALRGLAQDGVVFRHGAVVGFPSVSAPGHMTAGTGLWPGHHGILGNAQYGRAEGAVLSPFFVLDDPVAALQNPQSVLDLYDRVTRPEAETLAAAAHRALGRPDADGQGGAYVVVLNELALGDADYTSVDFLSAGQKRSLDDYRVADNLAMIQVESLLRHRGARVPTVLQLSFVSTDKAGESVGPHADETRQVLTEVDARVARLQAIYARHGVLERTLFVLVSDHGMELQDPGRSTRFDAALREAGVATRFTAQGLVHLATLRLEAARDDAGLWITVRDHDDGAPVVDAVVTCAACAVVEARTDAEGRALLGLAPAGVIVEATAPGFNPQAWTPP